MCGEKNKKNVLKSETFPLDNLATNEAFQTLIDQETIVTIHSQETSLDKIFIKITGKGHEKIV
jgi:fluoroquinolone transport system ATP-binding protein